MVSKNFWILATKGGEVDYILVDFVGQTLQKKEFVKMK